MFKMIKNSIDLIIEGEQLVKLAYKHNNIQVIIKFIFLFLKILFKIIKINVVNKVICIPDIANK